MRIVKEKENKEIKLVVKKQEKTFFIRITTDNTVDVVGFDNNEKIFDELFIYLKDILLRNFVQISFNSFF